MFIRQYLSWSDVVDDLRIASFNTVFNMTTVCAGCLEITGCVQTVYVIFLCLDRKVNCFLAKCNIENVQDCDVLGYRLFGIRDKVGKKWLVSCNSISTTDRQNFSGGGSFGSCFFLLGKSNFMTFRLDHRTNPQFCYQTYLHRYITSQSKNLIIKWYKRDILWKVIQRDWRYVKV